MVLHLCKDLMLVGKVSSWARANDVGYKSVGNVEKFGQLLSELDVQRVIIDLQFPSLDIPSVVETVRGAEGQLPVFGYAQHVMTDLIESAQAAGFDRVLTRGQFDRGFTELMGA